MTRQLREPFIISSWVNMCLEAFIGQGLDCRLLLRSANLCESDLESSLMPVPVEKVNRLFDTAVILSGSPCLGIEAGKNIHLTTFHALGYTVIASQSLWEGFSRIIRYQGGISNAARFYLHDDRDTVELGIIRDPSINLHDGILEASMCTLIRVCRFLSPTEPALTNVMLGRQRSEGYQHFDRFFRHPVHWGDNRYCLRFERSFFHRKLPTADAVLANENERLCETYFGRLFNRQLTQQVRMLLRQALVSDDISLQSIAQMLHISERSLQRRLSHEGVCFRDLVDELRQEDAERYLKSTSMSISQIAFRLGFNDAGNFSRAFKRWFSCSPESYRQNVRESSVY
ncbi:AraC family transcriptional regulator [Hahella sp. CCB-MM4]|uniref:AraC family transcriptional regulator n=1 Tax=Hahella sp. (strain CCB-MM4) TaxID=1926491 RepID=UPI000B9B4909|nr:AraC family transcriptional regulator [Hahella sp. CCB-MM4]OZG71653.1 AraC family transcriptional regulator [Hahella sp. CCB-MM4]